MVGKGDAMIHQKTLPELLKSKAQETPQGIVHWILDKDGLWSPISCHGFYHEVVHLAWDLKAKGIDKGHIVAIMASTGREWEIFHHAVLALGGIVVGIDPGEIAEQLEAIVKIAGVQTLIIDRLERLDKFSETTAAKFKAIITFGGKPGQGNRKNLVRIDIPKSQNGELNNPLLPDVAQPEDIATIIFTSGTTGAPKGIVYRHNQIIEAVDAILLNYPELLQRPCHLVCWLPLSNLFQRIVNICAIASGAEVYFVEQPQKIIDYLPQINPHIFIAVPRFFEKLYQGFEARLNQQPKIVAKCLQHCLDAGESHSLAGRLFKKLNRRLFKSFTMLFGSNIRYMVSGSAPMPLRLLRRFDAMGLLILEAYGMSENVVPIAANNATQYCFGSVGKALKGNTIKLSEDGELLVKGVGVFNGYLADQQHSNLSENGYLASGDYAEIDNQGFIHLTGRKSEVFKTSTGRKIAPAAIEALLKQDPMVEHAVVFGESRKYLVALITIAAAHRPIDEAAALSFAQNLAVSLAHCLSDLPAYKRPVGAVLSFEGFSIERQELTGNLKIRRKNILERYGAWIDGLYEALDTPQSAIHSRPLRGDPERVLLKL